MAEGPIRALTGRRRTRPTSIGCRNPWQPKPGRAPLIAAQAAVQTNRATSAVTVELDGRGTPTLSLVGGNGAIRQVQSTMTARSGGETGPLMLFTASPQGYSSLGSEPAGPR